MENATEESPLLHVTSDDAPTLLLAGDADDLIPIEHSRNIQAEFENKQVASKLIEFEGAGHNFPSDDMAKATEEMVVWFETHLMTLEK